jgi:hypothetical protein
VSLGVHRYGRIAITDTLPPPEGAADSTARRSNRGEDSDRICDSVTVRPPGSPPSIADLGRPAGDPTTNRRHGGPADGRIWNCNQARRLTGPQLGPGLGASPAHARPTCRPDLRLDQS